jgi:hypothetical protein
MILSEKCGFVFLKGRKVAGTSVEVLLASICGEKDIITPITPVDERIRLAAGTGAQNYGADVDELRSYLEEVEAADSEVMRELSPPKGNYYHHMSWREISKSYGEIPSDWLVLAVERDPYSKIISLANWWLNYSSYRAGGGMGGTKESLLLQIKKMVDEGSFERVKNIDIYRDKNGRLVPKIVRYEHLEADLELVFSKLRLSVPVNLPHLKKGTASNTLNPSDYFTSEQFEIINIAFAEEFRTFGYIQNMRNS